MSYDKIVDSGKLDSSLIAIADAIRSKTGGTEPMTLEDMPAVIEGINAGGDDEKFVAFVNGTMTDFVATPQMQGLRDGVFQSNKVLLTADLSRLGKKNGKLDALIGPDAFQKCSNLEHVILPDVLADATDSTQWMWSRAFEQTGLTEFNTVYPGIFNWNAVQVFRNSPALREVRIPNIKFGGSFEYFDACPALELVEFGGGKIGLRVFRNCAALSTVIIRSDTVAELADVGAFTGVTGPVTVYVKAGLIEEYQQATNWVTLYTAGTCIFTAIEGSEYE